MDAKFLATVVAVTSLGALGALWAKRAIGGSESAQHSALIVPTPTLGVRETPNSDTRANSGLSLIRLDLRKWTTDDSNLFMTINGQVTNYNSYPIKDVVVTCRHRGASDTFIDSNTRTIYRSVAAGGRLDIDEFPMGLIHSQAIRTSCSITNFSRI